MRLTTPFSTVLRHALIEVRFSDREYADPEAAWRLTQGEYLQVSNKGGKWHASSAYSPREVTIYDDTNPPVEVNFRHCHYDNRWVDMYWTLKDGTRGGKGRVFPQELGVTPERPEGDEKAKFEFAARWSDSKKEVKEIVKDKYWFSMSDGYTIKDFPIKIASKKGIDFRIRKAPANYYKRDQDGEVMSDESGRSLSMTPEEMKAAKKRSSTVTVGAFDGGDMIGMAADEWGAYLVSVNPDYRGRGIGAELAHTFLAICKQDSGGYSDNGIAMAKSVHARAIRDAMKLGWYQRAFKDGSLSGEKIQEITGK